MNVLIDECVDWRLARDIPGHSVKTARQMGWTSIKNGELLALAAAELDVLPPLRTKLRTDDGTDAVNVGGFRPWPRHQLKCRGI